MFLQNQKIRGIFYQVIVLLGVILLFNLGRINLVENLEQRNIETGYEFLSSESSFDISESVINFTPADTYARAFLVGILNTFKVVIIGSILAVLLGLIVGIFLLSKNWILRNISYSYVNFIRNTPLILQLFLWYILITEFLPFAKDATSFFGIYFTKRGLYLPTIVLSSVHYWILGFVILAIIIIIIFNRYAKRHQEKTGKSLPTFLVGVGLIFLAVVIPWAFSGFELNIEFPELGTFDINYGLYITPEFCTILFGLVIYTASFIAEIIRSGILAISKGQSEAGLAIGFKQGQLLRLIILPQAMRIIIPPLTNQILNLFKNSTLAVAIGYSDFVSIANTTLNQTGQAIEAITLLMAFYLSVSLLVSAFMNWFNHKMRIIER